MPAEFERWAEQEILRLRTEADALERALDKFRSSSQRSPSVPKPQRTQGSRKSAPRPKGKRKGSKTQKIMQFIQNQGNEGAALKQVYQFAAEHGLSMQKNSVRSVLYFEKGKGNLVLRDGRYYFSVNGPESHDSSPSTSIETGSPDQ